MPKPQNCCMGEVQLLGVAPVHTAPAACDLMLDVEKSGQ